MVMDEYKIGLLARWAARLRNIEDSDLAELLRLDALHKKVYQKNINRGFYEAHVCANKAVIKSILKPK